MDRGFFVPAGVFFFGVATRGAAAGG